MVWTLQMALEGCFPAVRKQLAQHGESVPPGCSIWLLRVCVRREVPRGSEVE